MGISAFIYSDIGSPYMGMSVLASARNEEKTIRMSKKSSKKTISRAKIYYFNKEKYKHKYKFSRFNHTSVRTISRSLNRRMILNSSYLSTMAVVGQKVKNGDLSYAGVYSPEAQEYSEITRRSKVKYRAKARLNSKNTSVANVELTKQAETESGTGGSEISNQVVEQVSNEPAYARRKAKKRIVRNDQVIPFVGAKTQKLYAIGEVGKYRERANDANWAVAGALSSDITNIYIPRTSRMAIRRSKI